MEAQNQSHFLGLKLKLPNHVVEGIQSQFPAPKDRLYHVVEEFLKQLEPEPTWRAIVEALRSPTIGLPRLVKELEEKHCAVSPVHSPNKTCNAGTPPQCSRQCSPPQPQAVNGASERDALKRRPCLPKYYNIAARSADGKAVKIIRGIGTKYPQFGTLLLNDDNGELVSALEHQHHHNTECINHAILAKWLEGNGREPRNWATLVSVLREMGLDNLISPTISMECNLYSS